MPSIRESPSDTVSLRSTGPGACPPGHAEILLRVLAVSGHGLWIWLGVALALGLDRVGRCDTLMPLMLGAVLVSAGLLLVCLRLPSVPDWHGWQPARGHRPTRAAQMVMATFLPVLLLIVLRGGVGHAWAIRLAGVVMMLGSLSSLVYIAYDDRRRLPPGLQRVSSSLPVSRVVTAGYSGGLWLWLCAMAQGGLEQPSNAYPWILLLLTLALLLGLLECLRWQSLDARMAPHRSLDAHEVSPLRFVAAIFVYVLPCTALLLTQRFGGGLLVAAVSVPSCLLGKMLEQRVYEAALGGETVVRR
jgi:hypothetical protein